jgi:hypothetical protein
MHKPYDPKGQIEEESRHQTRRIFAHLERGASVKDHVAHEHGRERKPQGNGLRGQAQEKRKRTEDEVAVSGR